jgi:cysteinyl-tRNA synthetase
MAIRLYDSLSRELRELKASHSDGVFRFYNCGPTVYAPAHIGNFRTFVVNDVLRRLLELEFGADKVRHVRNLTDVDDRTIGQTQKEKRPLGEITGKWTAKFHADCAALNCLRPHVEPTATGHIREQVDMIEVLMKKGNAYRAPDGSVYFRIASFPGYGRLSRIKERELKVTNSVFDADHKDDVGDFALWKAYKSDEDGNVQWPGPEGAAAGRPGWHIECSAMIKKHLGETIDLHTGGVDLLFPHHENEIAQSECCNGVPFSKHWYHSEHLLVEGTTMSKSKGNYYVLDDLVAKGYSPTAVRYALLSGHPRKQLNFTLDSLHAAESALEQLRNLLHEICVHAGKPTAGLLSDFDNAKPDLSTTGSFEPAFDALRNDLNIPTALGEVFAIRKAKYSHSLTSPKPAEPESSALEDYRALRNILFVLGLTLVHQVKKTEAPVNIRALAEKRWAAKQAKDFATADALRKELTAGGWAMLDRKDGYSLEPAKK